MSYRSEIALTVCANVHTHVELHNSNSSVLSTYSAISTAYVRLHAVRISSHLLLHWKPYFWRDPSGPNHYFVSNRCLINYGTCFWWQTNTTLFFCITRCIFLQLLHQTTHALNKMYFMRSINLIHVSAPECHPRVTVLKQRDTSPTR